MERFNQKVVKHNVGEIPEQLERKIERVNEKIMTWTERTVAEVEGRVHELQERSKEEVEELIAYAAQFGVTLEVEVIQVPILDTTIEVDPVLVTGD